MTRQQKLNWLHRIGYVTTAIVTAELLIVGILAGYQWQEDSRRRANAFDQTKTHQGPISANRLRYRPDAINLLETLPPLNSIKGDGLRFVAMPSLSNSWFALAIKTSPDANRAEGVIKVLAHPGPNEELTITHRIRFSMARPAGERLLTDIRLLTSDWQGEDSACLDGTSVAFELAIRKGITSGAGNSACSDHYGQLSTIVLDAIGHILPDKLRPVDANWRPRTNDSVMRILETKLS